ncbi:hypothetical protein C0V78_04375 [Novosphingobium sp. TH158]|nr:hypothetical protein C0V78_04375 [Novosphingobium sp. TH158]
MIAAGLAALAAGSMAGGPRTMTQPAIAESPAQALPAPPANGVMGFVVSDFTPPVIQGKDACPDGPALKLRDSYLAGLDPGERARLTLKENEKELTSRWQATAFGPNGTNLCSQPDMFKRPEMRTVQSKVAWGLDLDEGGGGDTCAHEGFTTPTGETGIDNQEYRALGCKLEWRGVDGMTGDQEVGLKQFYSSGEWTQVILLKGVDSLQNDPQVEVIYANTPDRPVIDGKGNWLRGMTFSISDTAPRHRNVLKGKIVNGVLTTEPATIKLAQTWGQGGTRDIRGNRGKWEYHKARIRLAFQPDGSMKGMLGGYRPVFDPILSPSLGGAGSALVAGIDCAAELAALKKLADGLKDPKTGKCTGISGAQRMAAIPAFVNDIPQRTASR